MPLIDTPKAADILCGKDKTFGKHPGNMLYRDLIEAKALDYAAAVYKLDKMKLTTEIVATMVTEFGSRFLRPVGITINKETGTSTYTPTELGGATTTTSDGNITTQMIGWEEISLTAARDKTSHALRFCAANTVPNRTAAIVASNTSSSNDDNNNNANNNTLSGIYEPQIQGQDNVVIVTHPPGGMLHAVTATDVTNTIAGNNNSNGDSSTNNISLIQAQLYNSTIAVSTPSSSAIINGTQNINQEELLQQQNNSLQKGLEELIHQKMKQQSELQQQQNHQQPEHQQQQSSIQLLTSMDSMAAASRNTKFKKLPIKAASLLSKTKMKMLPAELLNSTSTPVKLNRVKVQKSSRKPKINKTPSATTSNTATATMMKMMQNHHQQQQQQQQQMMYQNYIIPPPHMLPVHNMQHPHHLQFASGSYTTASSNNSPNRPGIVVVTTPPIPPATPVVTSTTTAPNKDAEETSATTGPTLTAMSARTVSADMNVLATAAAAVEAAEAHAVAIAAREAAVAATVTGASKK